MTVYNKQIGIELGSLNLNDKKQMVFIDQHVLVGRNEDTAKLCAAFRQAFADASMNPLLVTAYGAYREIDVQNADKNKISEQISLEFIADANQDLTNAMYAYEEAETFVQSPDDEGPFVSHETMMQVYDEFTQSNRGLVLTASDGVTKIHHVSITHRFRPIVAQIDCNKFNVTVKIDADKSINIFTRHRDKNVRIGFRMYSGL